MQKAALLPLRGCRGRVEHPPDRGDHGGQYIAVVRNRPPPPTTSLTDELAKAVTGAPLAMASSAGSPKPS